MTKTAKREASTAESRAATVPQERVAGREPPSKSSPPFTQSRAATPSPSLIRGPRVVHQRRTLNLVAITSQLPTSNLSNPNLAS